MKIYTFLILFLFQSFLTNGSAEKPKEVDLLRLADDIIALYKSKEEALVKLGDSFESFREKYSSREERINLVKNIKFSDEYFREILNLYLLRSNFDGEKETYYNPTRLVLITLLNQADFKIDNALARHSEISKLVFKYYNYFDFRGETKKAQKVKKLHDVYFY